MKNYNFFYIKEPINGGSNYDSTMIGGPDCQFVVSTSNYSAQPITTSSSHEPAVIAHPSLSVEVMNRH
jgi:hypothetical protein